MFRSAAALGLVAIAGTSMLTGVDWLTADRIAAQERRVILEQLGELIPEEYDNAGRRALEIAATQQGSARKQAELVKEVLRQ